MTIRLYRYLLWLYPAAFREHFAREMCVVLADRMREQPSRALPIWLGAAAAVLFHAPEEHFHMIRQDLVYALRLARKDPLFTAIAVLVMAAGIGVNAIVFTLANGMIFRELPYPEPQQLVAIEEFEAGGISGAVAYPNYRDLEASTRTLSGIVLYGSAEFILRGEGSAEAVQGASFTASGASVFGIRPILGRLFTPEEDQPKAAPVVLIGEDLWRARFGADPAILERTINLNDQPHRVIGVMPHGFVFPGRAEVWRPLREDAKTSTRTDHGYGAVGRLEPGVTIERAQEELRALFSVIRSKYPKEMYNQTINVAAYPKEIGDRLKPALYTLLGAVGLVLLIACANVTNLLLAKAAGRTREVAVRSALGASAARLARQLVVESLMLGIAGAAIGGLMAYALTPAVVNLFPYGIPKWVDFTPDWRVIGFLAAITILTSLIAGLVPALAALRRDTISALREGGRSMTAGLSRGRLDRAIIVGEVALSLLLLVGAGLMIRTLVALRTQSNGFRVEGVTTLSTAPPSSRYPRGSAGLELCRRIEAEIRTIPGVTSAATTTAPPLLAGWGRSLTVEGRPMLALKDAPLISHFVVAPRYFQSLGIPILEGRDFEAGDNDKNRVTIVDEKIARKYWPKGEAVGKRIRFGPPEDNEPWHTIVGVVGVVRGESIREIRRDTVYLPHAEFGWAGMNWVIRSDSPSGPDPEVLRRKIQSVDANIAVMRIRTMQQVVSEVTGRDSFVTVLLAAFAAIALGLAAIGLYGLMAHLVARRSHELGIRIALGATSGAILRQVMSESGRLIIAGIVIGAGAAAMLVRVLESQLYQVRPWDPMAFGGSIAVLALAGLAAAYLPARRATRVDPLAALKSE